ncbi:HAD family hydrolase [Nocardia inohanensis]|uniref:HAD family hydrolase n=1 Tax=Nocardia inohanensis TaxID=209246 RepID=UPI00082EF03F|nr:HAD family phosphatase [Nocardia inohanensis]
MSGRIEAVLFDLDGTLAATMAPWDRCWSDYAARHGHTWTEIDRRRTHGHGDWAHHLAAVCGIDSVERVITDCVNLMVAQVNSGRVDLLPGIPELLTTAAARSVTGVVSASPRRFVTAALTHFDLLSSMRVVVAREDRAETKPHPAPWLHAAQQLDVDPSRCVAVEDSAAGIRSAHAAGMRVLAIPSWSPSIHPPEADLADHLAADAFQARGWLRETLTAPMESVASSR